MRQVAAPRRASALAAGAVLLLAGCAGQLVVGQATPGAGEPVDVAAGRVPDHRGRRRRRSTSSPATRSPT